MGTNSEKFRTNDPNSSKGGAHSIEANIAIEGQLAIVMRRLEALEIKEPVSVNQVSPTPSVSYTYYQAMNYVFEECPVFLYHQLLPKNINATFTRPTNNPYTPTYNPGWRNHPNFSWSQNKRYPLPTISPIFSVINNYFPTKFLKVPTLKRT